MSIVVFITSIVGSFKGALVTEIIREKRDALVFEEASWWRVLKSREHSPPPSAARETGYALGQRTGKERESTPDPPGSPMGIPIR